MRVFLVSSASTLVFLAVLLLSAGRLNYWPAWVYTVIGMLTNVLMHWILRKDPDLARERSRPGSGIEAWDRKLLGLGLLLNIAMLVIAGLDSGRNHWTPRLSWVWSACGALLILLGMVVFLLAMKENRFFSPVVRIQRDRGHTVCTSGTYRIIRHPGNAGMILSATGFPLLFMSAWSAIPALLSVVLLIARTRLEDAVLEKELEGYRDYQRTTPYRLAPGIW